MIIKINNILKIKMVNKRKILAGISSFLMILIMSLCFTFTFIIADNTVNAVGVVLENSSTVKADIKNLLQDSFDSMSSTLSFETKGLEIAKKILETDSSGNLKQPFEMRSIINDAIDEQLIRMIPSNYNAYTRFSLKGYEISNGISYSTQNGEIKAITISISFKFLWHDGLNPLAGRNAVINHAKVFLNSTEYKSKTTDYEKIKAINNYICRTFQYDYRLFVPSQADETIYTAYKMISDASGIGGYPRGVCQAYSMYGYIMLKEAGYDAITIDGHAPIPPSGQSDSNPHAWNMVKIGSYWYHIDFTWNDPVTGGNPAPYYTRQKGAGSISENYLLRSDQELNINHIWSTTQSGYTYPKALNKWTGTPVIVDVTLPPAPTVKPTAIPTKIITATPTKKPTVPASSSSSKSGMQSEISKNSSNSDSNSIDEKNSKDMVSADTSDKISDGLSQSSKNNTSINEDDIKTVNIKGQLMDKDNNPLSGLKLELYNSSKVSLTDRDGNFNFENVKPGSYKFYLSDLNGKQISQLPIVISYGESTELNSDTITVKNGSLKMNLILKDGNLRIGEISESMFQISDETMLKILIALAVIILIIILVALKNRRRE